VTHDETTHVPQRAVYEAAGKINITRGGRGFSTRSMSWGVNEELSDLYSLPNIVRVVKSRRMRWAGHVARIGEG